jgi:FkbM family methyltransferase
MQSLKSQLRSTYFGAVYRKFAQRWRAVRQDRNMRQFYAQFIKSGDLAFDVGAYRGSRTNIFLRLGAHVIAVEPVFESVVTLSIRFHDNPRVRIIPKALGAIEGRADMLISQPFPYSSSLSKKYVQSKAESGHNEVLAWRETRTVGVTTLDKLIEQFGLPAFVKIDVEGYEDQVFQGLTHPLSALSFEFHPHILEPALQSIDYLKRFGALRANYAIGEQFEWMLDQWVTPDELIRILKSFEPKTDFLYGDVYVRFNQS